jgi:predicted dehydrogenase
LKILKIGVIGLGVGEAHLRGYQAISGCEVAAICDINPERLNEIGDRYGVANRFTDYKKIIENPDIDAVSICSYDDAHCEQVVAAFKHDKHVMVEKPLSLYKSESEKIARAFEDSGKLLTSNLVLRESPRFRQLKADIEAGEYGDLFYIEGDYLHEILWKITSGWRGNMDFYCTMYGGGVHLIDLMRWFVGEEVKTVQAVGTNLPTKESKYKFDDTFLAIMKFKNSVIGKSTTTFAPQRPKFHALNVYGSKKTFINDYEKASIYHGTEPEDVEIIEGGYRGGNDKAILIPDFVNAIRENRKPIVNEVDVFRVMDICFAAWEAAQSGQTVAVNYTI